MIIYELTCAHAHRFEGWFASGDDYLSQRERGLVTCPMCDDGSVERVPSARVSVPKGTSGTRAVPAPVANPTASAATPSEPRHAAAALPAELLAKLREVVKQPKNVGTRFPGGGAAHPLRRSAGASDPWAGKCRRSEGAGGARASSSPPCRRSCCRTRTDPRTSRGIATSHRRRRRCAGGGSTRWRSTSRRSTRFPRWDRSRSRSVRNGRPVARTPRRCRGQ